jgi:hypothetical protein
MIALAAPIASKPVAIGNDVQVTDLRDAAYKEAGNKDGSPETLSRRQLGLYSLIEGKKKFWAYVAKKGKGLKDNAAKGEIGHQEGHVCMQAW